MGLERAAAAQAALGALEHGGAHAGELHLAFARRCARLCEVSTLLLCARAEPSVSRQAPLAVTATQECVRVAQLPPLVAEI